jgi:hypothetical protein
MPLSFVELLEHHEHVHVVRSFRFDEQAREYDL